MVQPVDPDTGRVTPELRLRRNPRRTQPGDQGPVSHAEPSYADMAALG
jgi:hypothetical protein